MESVWKQENDKILCDAKPLLTRATERPFRCLDCKMSLSLLRIVYVLLTNPSHAEQTM